LAPPSPRIFVDLTLFCFHSGWIPNTDLHDLNPETVLDVKMDKMRKDLQAAHQLASENNSLQHYKEVLQHYQDDLLEKQKAKEAKAQSTPAKKSKKAKAEVDDDEDVDMADAVEEGVKEKKAKKRKADESAEVRKDPLYATCHRAITIRPPTSSYLTFIPTDSTAL
jgi:hypothetical protein